MTHRQLTAIHEAGHAVVAVLEGLSVIEAIAEPGTSRVRVRGGATGAFLVAGIVAERIADPAVTELEEMEGPMPAHHPWRRDLEAFAELQRLRRAGRFALERLLVEQQLRRRWPAVLAVADLLLERGRVEGEVVHKIVAEAERIEGERRTSDRDDGGVAHSGREAANPHGSGTSRVLPETFEMGIAQRSSSASDRGQPGCFVSEEGADR